MVKLAFIIKAQVNFRSRTILRKILPMKDEPLMSIGQIAKRTGVAVSAVRFYADESLIPCVRSTGGQRHFKRSVIRRLSFILISQEMGYTLSQIKKQLASLPDNRTPTKSDWDKLSKRFTQDIDAQIALLQNLKDSISGCIGCGCLSLNSCRLYNPEDGISRKGAGPRYLMGNSSSEL